MKFEKALLYVVVLLLFACNQTDNKTLIFIDNGIWQGNEILKEKSDWYMTDFLKAMQETPEKVNNYKAKADKMQLLQANVDLLIDEINANWISNNDTSENNLLVTTNIKKQELFDEILMCRNYLISSVNSKEKRYYFWLPVRSGTTLNQYF